MLRGKYADNRTGTLVRAKAEFEARWKQWKAWAGGRSPDWLKFKKPTAPAVKREAEEDWR
jgi:hypothetical protein